jgi:ATP-dependent RNA helicase SUPV3L1/SUV3
MPSARALAAQGLRAVGGLAVPVEALERLAAILREAPRRGGATLLAEDAGQVLGWSPAETAAILRGLGYAPASKPKAGEAGAWRRRRDKAANGPPAEAARPSPFAALAALKPSATATTRRRRRPRRRAKAAT